MSERSTVRTLLSTGLVTGLATGLALAAVPPGAATEPGHSLALTGPAAAGIGTPSTMTATGTVPADVFLNRYVNVYAIPQSVLASCPADYTAGMNAAYGSSSAGGTTVANHVQVEGGFSVPIVWTPTHAGTFLLCGYLHEGVETMAYAQHVMSVSGAATPPAPPTPGTPGTPGTGQSAPDMLTATGLKRKGARLVCTRGTWSGSPTSYSWVWKVDGKRKAKATSSKLRVTRALRGSKVRCGVVATNAAGSTTGLSRTLKVR